MAVRGIRGATTCLADADAILAATRELLEAILKANPSVQTAWILRVHGLRLPTIYSLCIPPKQQEKWAGTMFRSCAQPR